MFRVGNLVILVIPGELTTMAGRRIRYDRIPGFISRHGGCRSSQYKNGRMAHTLFHLYRNAIRARLVADGIIGNDAYVVIAGPANTYAHYVTTIEEYGVQRYEGASTLFGPCESPVCLWRREISLTVWDVADTLDAYINKYSSLVSYLADNATAGKVPPSDPAPPDLTSAAISFRVRPRTLSRLVSPMDHRCRPDWCGLRQRRHRPQIR